MHDRRSFLIRIGSGLALAATPGALAAAPSTAAQPTTHQALETLVAGNRRFARDESIPIRHSLRRAELAAGQNPFAIVVSCSDSRVPVETVFDQPPGAVFGVRVAGNFVDGHGLGSIEYAVASFSSPLILVLGHTACGAVKATVQYAKDGAAQPGHIQSLVDAILPAARATEGESDWVASATQQNVRDNMRALAARSTIVRDAVASGKTAIAGGIYDLANGTVTLLA